ncbi:AMP-binding protein, partial [Mesorhizobium sp.]|uniref:AMP-binding protein n=1 Tax=Mesorhizobium sp. TaxID=1871066 RepID=UPI0032AF5189
MTAAPAPFSARHIGPSVNDVRAMLAAIGVPSVETLISQAVPKSIRLDRPLDLPAPASEAEALAELSAMMAKNTVLKSFIGAGYHGVFVPPVIQRNLFENPAWYTAYTPYQAEISQGRLEMLFNFQTLVTELTGLPVASASLLDEATAVAEAVGIALRHHRDKRTKVALAGTPHPQTLDVVRTRAEPLGIEVDGETIDDNTAALLVSWPDTLGVYGDHKAAIEKARAAGALVVFIADPLALTLTDEEPVFAIDYTIAQAWWMKPFMKLARALPLNPAKPMSTRTLIKIVQGGDPLVIFPEGRITVTGGLMKVYDGAAMVADKTGSMVVPVRIEGLEKSYFSRLTSQHVRHRLFPKVKVTILEPVKLEVPQELKGRQRRAAAGSALYQVMSDLVFRTQNIDKTVLQKIIETAHERGMKELAVQDPVTGSLSYGKLLTAAAVLGEKFEHLYAGQETLGIMLPNANGSCATLLGVMSAGKVPAMINFTAGAANILSACKAAEVKTVLTSRAFVEQAKLGPVIEEIGRSVDIVWLDDLRATIGLKDKLLGLLRKTTPRVARKADDPAAILFTSGSEGTPKGVVLTHRNILANAAQAASRIDFHSGDKVFNVLPIFHSFGMTAGTVLPLISGVPVYFYPSPLHYRIVPELIYGSNATIIFGTDTFLAGYARTAHPYDFRSVRYCFA